MRNRIFGYRCRPALARIIHTLRSEVPEMLETARKTSEATAGVFLKYVEDR